MPRKQRPKQPFRLYRRPNSPFWWVYFHIPNQPKPHRLSTEVVLARGDEAARKAAELYLEHAARAHELAPAVVVQQLSLKQLDELWLEQLEADHPGNDAYVNRVTTDLTEYIEKRWAQVGEITTASWRTASYDPDTGAAGELHHSRGGPLKWRSIAHLANTLRHFLRFCVKRGALAVVPEIQSPPTKLQKADRAPRKAIDDDNREKFLTALLDLGEERAHRIYTVLFEEWVRKSTLEAMTLRWIDWKGETITLPAQHNKSRKEKTIDLTPVAASAIRAEIATWKKDDVVNMDRPVFGRFDFHQAKTRHRRVQDEQGEWHDVDVLDGGVFGRACRKAGIDGHGLTAHHTTRHSAMTSAGRNPEATLSGMMKQSGIDSARIIEEHYLHPAMEDARRITRSKSK